MTRRHQLFASSDTRGECRHSRRFSGLPRRFSILHPPSSASIAFTLVELLVVVAIIGIVMTIAIPSIYRQLHPDSMQKAVTDLMEACSHARAMAILNRQPVAMTISPYTRQIKVGGSVASLGRLESKNVAGEDWRMADRGSTSSGGMGSFSAKLSDRIQIKLIDVNFVDYTEAESASVRFYENGMSDEFTIVLANNEGEWRKISLEVVTGLADIETDMQKVLDELR